MLLSHAIYSQAIPRLGDMVGDVGKETGAQLLLNDS